MPEHIIKEDEQTSEAPEEISQEEVKAEEQERPEWLPEKFKSPEDMAKAYGELEKSFTKSRQEDAPKEAEAEEQPAEEKETLEMVEIAKKDAENVKARIVEEGRIEIKRMKEQASFVLKQEQRKAEDDLRRWIAEESVKLASVNLKKKMNSNFEDKLVKDFVDQINQNKGIL